MLILENTMYESLQAHYGRLVSVAMRCDGITLADFLRHARGNPRFYMESQRDDVAFAGMGMALEIFAYGTHRFETVQHRAQELFADAMLLNDAPDFAAPRLFGGFAFLDDFVPEYAWSDFPPAHFVLPHYQLTRHNGETWLTINAHLPYGENPQELLPDLQDALEAKIAQLRAESPALPRPNSQLDIRYPMSFENWSAAIHDALAQMQTGDLKKVVLARACELRFKDHVNVDAALDFLAQAYPETYRFLFEPRPYHAFYGATPELLAQVSGAEVKTMALAGSMRRGSTPEEDATLGAELIGDSKNAHEHDLVIHGIRTRLEPFVQHVNMGETGLMKLKNIQHIYTPISGTLQHQNGILPIVAALHPTPALGGDPREVAIKLISRSEPVPRGWYAAPVGWIDGKQNGQFVVGIRSAVAQESRVWLYAGCGIVPGSDPQKEWDEATLKFKPMLNALNVSA
jgi:menaquinone-specific isochorismate synthase